MGHVRWGIVVGLVALLVVGCGRQTEAEGAEPVHYVGEVARLNAYVGIAISGEQVMAYVCDGDTFGEWFKGTVGSDGTLDLTNDGGAHLTASISGDSASGEFASAGGKALNFEAEIAAGDAGLYRITETVDGENSVAGWVINNNGEVRGGKRTGTVFVGWVDPDPKPFTNPKLDPVLVP